MMFQKLMNPILQDIPGIICYVIDILVTGSDDKEHLKCLMVVLYYLENNGLPTQEGRSSLSSRLSRLPRWRSESARTPIHFKQGASNHKNTSFQKAARICKFFRKFAITANYFQVRWQFCFLWINSYEPLWSGNGHSTASELSKLQSTIYLLHKCWHTTTQYCP